MTPPEAAPPALHTLRANGCELAYVERHPELRGEGPTLFFVHATGFHARVWDGIVARLRPHHSIALDQRGHGRSEKIALTHWRTAGDDQAELLRALDLRDVVGVAHSMGAHAMIDAAAALPDRFLRLVLIDPTVSSPESYAAPLEPSPFGEGEMHPAAKRRNRFASVDAMVERLKDRSAFPRFDPRIFRDYCEHALVPAGDGDGFVLACPPEIEASVYMTARTNGGVYDSVRSLQLPVLVLRAQELTDDLTGPMRFSGSPTWPGLAAEFPNAREIHYPDKTHFLPMEIPDEVARLIRQEVDAASAT